MIFYLPLTLPGPSLRSPHSGRGQSNTYPNQRQRRGNKKGASFPEIALRRPVVVPLGLVTVLLWG